jgi:hypothetical protein
VIVGRIRQILPRPEATLPGLHAGVLQQQLNLIQFAAARAAQLR